MKTLIAGPWVGEFGWELFAWQAYVRSLSENYDKTVIICRESSNFLYEDYADDFINVNPTAGLPDAFFMHNLDIQKLIRECLMGENKHLLNGDTTIFPPRRIGYPPQTHYTESFKMGSYDIIPKYIKYGKNTNTNIKYVFHVRQRELRKKDNWKLENWNSLRDKLGVNPSEIACIGTRKESSHLEGTIDMRGEKLSTVCDILSSAKCIFGPSSGPMHLATLCKCPQVVWSINSNDTRYNVTWNPFDTRVLFLSEYSWHPSPEYVMEKFNNWF